MQYSDIQQSYKSYALREKGIRSGTYKATEFIVRALCEFSATENIKKHDESMVRAFLQHMSKERVWSPKTFRIYRQYLKSFFDWAIKEQIVTKNPCIGIDRPKLPSRLPRCLTHEETLKILTQARWYDWHYQIEKTRNEAIIAMFVFSGIRLSELIHLKIEHVNLETQELFIDQGKNRKDRIVALHTTLLPVLRSYVIERRRLCKPSQWFFSGVRSNMKLASKNVQGMLRKISIAAGIKVTPHMLRHTFGRLCVDANVNLRMIQHMMGHSDISTTQIYTHVSTKSMKANFAEVCLL
jgi:site-specific recombinase XerD